MTSVLCNAERSGSAALGGGRNEGCKKALRTQNSQAFAQTTRERSSSSCCVCRDRGGVCLMRLVVEIGLLSLIVLAGFEEI